MKRGLFLVICIVLSAVYFGGCTEKDGQLYVKPEQTFAKVCEHNDKYLFINPTDHKLYQLDSNNHGMLFYDAEMELFSLTNERLIFVDMQRRLVFVDTENDEESVLGQVGETYREPMGNMYGQAGEVAVYSDRIAYKDQDDQLIVMDYDGNQIAEIPDVVTFAPYQGGLCYVCRSGLLGGEMKLMRMDLNGNFREELDDHWVYKLQATDDGVYAVAEDYALYRIIGPDVREEMLRPDWFDFAVSDDYIVSVTEEGLVILNKTSRESELVDDNNGNRILYIEGNTLVYDNDGIYIYNIKEKTTRQVDELGTCLYCGILDDRIWMMFGQYDEDADTTEPKRCVFYTMDGELICSLE